MGEVTKLALKFREWLVKCQQALDQRNYTDTLPDFPAEQFLKEIGRAAANEKRAELDPEPTLTGLAAIIRRHGRRVAQELEACSCNSSNVTVNRMNLIKKSHLGRLEAGILELLCKAKIANTLYKSRHRQGISLRQLELRSSVSYSYLSQIERLGGSLPSSEILSSLDTALLSTIAPDGASDISLLKQRLDYDNTAQLVQQEETRLVNAWQQLMGGASFYAISHRNLAVQQREGLKEQDRPETADQKILTESPDSGAMPGIRHPAASNAVIDNEHDEMDDDDESDDDGDYNGCGDGRGVTATSSGFPDNKRLDNKGLEAAGPGYGEDLTFELCDCFVELTPDIQRAVLRFVKDLARPHKGRSR